MEDRTRSFIEKSTLLFIASRNATGGMDVSPRGGQPCVVRIADDGRLLLPDYLGNRRLDTIGNVLSNPDVALILLNRRSDEYLRIAASATVSREPQDIAAFPADENRPLSVMVLKPGRMEFVSNKTFEKSGFWIDPADRKPPLDVLEIYASDGRWQAESGHRSVLYDAAAESRLAEAGLRETYGTPSPLVQTKAYGMAGPGFLGFIGAARFIVLARESDTGEILLELAAGPLRSDPGTNRQSFLIDVEPDMSAAPHSAEFALLGVEPGRPDIIRINGAYREVGAEIGGQRRLALHPEEIYFHCPAAFSRSRIWTNARPIAWSGRRSFTCVTRTRESPDVVSFVLEPRDGAPIGDAAPGQYVNVSLPHDDHPMPRRRSYSISGVPDTRSLRISVRRVGNEGVSALLHDTVAVGDEVWVGPPAGQFVLDSAPLRPVVLVSAGVGITPLLPMVEQLAQEVSARDVWFVHVARDARHHVFAEEAKRIAAANPRIRLLTAYSRPQTGDSCHHRGRLDAEALAAHVPVAEADFYICGPGAFMDSLNRGLIERGAAPESIRIEAFEQKQIGAAFASTGALTKGASCSVIFARSDKNVTWQPESGSLLDLALANGVDVQYSCRNGECQSCAQRIVSGGVSYPAGDEPLLPRGQVLLCQAVPRGDIVIDC
ncbi:MAG: pyridoxamine 5'-phosphate oxidase family protein [Aquamicrobium sp.]|jgi:ferredoxin-NADP reductase/predicted pyridoxine 5'-phosphate oxidase superfamily flavin-nucleotide-binding protein|nr:pyridoxamine 5'-phosphate oxidase family protein [Aquamicrobium sp.]